MLGEGGVLALLKTPLVDHNAPVIKEDLHGIGAEEDLYLLAGKLIRDAIEVLLDFDVIIDIHFRLFEIDISVPLGRKGLKIRSLYSFEELPAAAIEFPEFPCIEAFQKLFDLDIKLLNAKERMVSQGRDNPSGDQKDANLDLGLIMESFS